MVDENRSGSRPRRRYRPPRVKYFYLNSELHKTERVNNAQDLIWAWNYPMGKSVVYVWSDARKRMEKAFSITQVGRMIGRTRVTIEQIILDGKIKVPQRAYTLDERRKPGKYWFSERDVLGLHDYLLTVHIGRPRKDGQITPGKMPSKAELRAMMTHDTVMYVKSSDGEFVPVWKEVEW